ncbi:hypothetical protein MRX96_056642 [Rhipicephalus microplus]
MCAAHTFAVPRPPPEEKETEGKGSSFLLLSISLIPVCGGEACLETPEKLEMAQVFVLPAFFRNLLAARPLSRRVTDILGPDESKPAREAVRSVGAVGRRSSTAFMMVLKSLESNDLTSFIVSFIT